MPASPAPVTRRRWCSIRTIEIDLPENATLALYTDGLVEARGRDIETGLDMLRAELAGEPHGSG